MLQKLCSPGVRFSKWCSQLVQKLCSPGVLFPQNGALSCCKICSCCRSNAVEKENYLRLAQTLVFVGAKLPSNKTVVKLVQLVCSSGAKIVLIWCFSFQHFAHSCCQERNAGGGCMCGGCELMWSGRVVWQDEVVEKKAHKWSRQEK